MLWKYFYYSFHLLSLSLFRADPRLSCIIAVVAVAATTVAVFAILVYATLSHKNTMCPTLTICLPLMPFNLFPEEEDGKNDTFCSFHLLHHQVKVLSSTENEMAARVFNARAEVNPIACECETVFDAITFFSSLWFRFHKSKSSSFIVSHSQDLKDDDTL